MKLRASLRFEYYYYLGTFLFLFFKCNVNGSLSSGSGYKDLPLFHTKKFVSTLINAFFFVCVCVLEKTKNNKLRAFVI